jgi:hypothetical protein
VSWVEQAQNYGLTTAQRERRHPNVQLPVVHGDAEASVLGQALFGDVEVGLELQTGRDGGSDAYVCLQMLVQHPVDAQAHAQDLLVRLDMDVGCS